MTGHTLNIYLAKNFLRNVVMIFLLFFFLIVAVDLIELSRELGKSIKVDFSDLLLIGVFRAPAFAENILPFAVLFGAATSLILLNKRLELVVARASGVSVWQFLTPVALAAALLGAFSSVIYNPLSLSGLDASRSLEAAIFGRVKGSFTNKSKNFWVRLGQEEGDVIIRARVSQDHGAKLSAVSVYMFDGAGGVKQRMDAASALFVEGAENKNHYLLTDVSITVPGEKPEESPTFELDVSISKAQLQQGQTSAESVSFWQLGEQAGQASVSGKNALPFYTRFQALLAQPLLFVAMVLLAATVSLTFTRFGQSGRVILGGVLAGFVLYVVTKLVITFGSNGLVPPFIAAWSPAIVATLITTTILLHQEDG